MHSSEKWRLLLTLVNAIMADLPIVNSSLKISRGCLEEHNVEVIFGYPGGAILPVYDALFKKKKIKHILVRHEPAAVRAVALAHREP